MPNRSKLLLRSRRRPHGQPGDYPLSVQACEFSMVKTEYHRSVRRYEELHREFEMLEDWTKLFTPATHPYIAHFTPAMARARRAYHDTDRGAGPAIRARNRAKQAFRHSTEGNLNLAKLAIEGVKAKLRAAEARLRFWLQNLAAYNPAKGGVQNHLDRIDVHLGTALTYLKEAQEDFRHAREKAGLWGYGDLGPLPTA